jgi:hypothetical protein
MSLYGERCTCTCMYIHTYNRLVLSLVLVQPIHTRRPSHRVLRECWLWAAVVFGISTCSPSRQRRHWVRGKQPERLATKRSLNSCAPAHRARASPTASSPCSSIPTHPADLKPRDAPHLELVGSRARSSPSKPHALDPTPPVLGPEVCDGGDRHIDMARHKCAEYVSTLQSRCNWASVRGRLLGGARSESAAGEMASEEAGLSNYGEQQPASCTRGQEHG